MTLPVILTLILLAYGFIDLAMANYVAAPFLAPVLIFFVWMAFNQKKSLEKLSEENKELKKMIKKVLKNQSCDNSEPSAAEQNNSEQSVAKQNNSEPSATEQDNSGTDEK